MMRKKCLEVVTVLLSMFVSDVCVAQETRTFPDKGRLTIGVRSEARPFSYKLPKQVVDSDATRGPLSHSGYGGYMVRICDAVLAEMLIPDPKSGLDLAPADVKIYNLDSAQISQTAPVDASNPAADADNGSQEDDAGSAERRFDGLGRDFDILCDPATITNAQREYFVSPPLFLSGIGYLSLSGAAPPQDPCGAPGPTPKPDPRVVEARKGFDGAAAALLAPPNTPVAQGPPRPALIGLVKGTTAAREGLHALVEAREMPRYGEQLTAYLRGKKFGTCKDERQLIISYPDHRAAARGFCIDKAFHYYVGDLEIIRTYAEAIPGCRFDNGAATYTNDRYAIFGKAIGADGSAPSPPTPSEIDRQLLVGRFFEILSQKVVFFPSVLDKAYEDTFPGKPKSPKLQYFYWSIRGESRPDLAAFEQKDSSSQNSQSAK